MESYVVGALLGVVFTAVVMRQWPFLRRVRASKLALAMRELDAQLALMSRDHDAQAKRLALAEHAQSESIASGQLLLAQIDAQTAALADVQGQLRAVQQRASGCAEQATRIAEEASRLKGLSVTFERWHEQMISLME